MDTRSQERSEELSAMRCQESAAWMKTVRNIRWHTVLIDTLKTETSNFVLNPSFTGSQWSVLSSAVALACMDLRRTSRAA